MPAPSHSARHKHYLKGLRAEWVAAQYLRLRGWRIIAMRFKTPLGEIDLIAKRGHTIAFIEVKARKSYRGAAEAIHSGNQQRVVRAAQWFVSAHKNYADYYLRFDACLVPWYYWPTFIPHAFGA